MKTRLAIIAFAAILLTVILCAVHVHKDVSYQKEHDDIGIAIAAASVIGCLSTAEIVVSEICAAVGVYKIWENKRLARPKALPRALLTVSILSFITGVDALLELPLMTFLMKTIARIYPEASEYYGRMIVYEYCASLILTVAAVVLTMIVLKKYKPEGEEDHPELLRDND